MVQVRCPTLHCGEGRKGKGKLRGVAGIAAQLPP